MKARWVTTSILCKHCYREALISSLGLLVYLVILRITLLLKGLSKSKMSSSSCCFLYVKIRRVALLPLDALRLDT
jgi:hypothetical protein